MIKITNSLLKSLFKPLAINFAKQAPAKGGKDAKKGGKQQAKPQQPLKSQQQLANQKLLPHQKLLKYFSPHQPGLSPSQTEALNNNFNDISQEEKQMLDVVAGKIAGLNTSLFYDFVFRKEGLGTTETFFVGTGLPRLLKYSGRMFDPGQAQQYSFK